MIYSSKDWLKDEVNQKFVEAKFQESMLAFLEQEEQWIYANNDIEIPLEEFISRKASLEAKLKDMHARKKAYVNFPDYLENITAFYTNATSQLAKLIKEKTWVSNETFKPISTKIAELKQWIANKTLERNNTPATSDPILTENMIKSKKISISVLLKELMKIKKPKPKPKVIIGTCPAKHLSQLKDEAKPICPNTNASVSQIKEDL